MIATIIVKKGMDKCCPRLKTMILKEKNIKCSNKFLAGNLKPYYGEVIWMKDLVATNNTG